MATPSSSSPNPDRDLPFSSPPPERMGLPLGAWVAAAVIVLLVLGGILFAAHRKPALAANAVLPPDGYADRLVISDLAMSESTSLSGGKSTFIDGKVRNTGASTVTDATLQVLFGNDEALAPQVETLPLTLIRTREPYVDTQLVSAAPLAPGDAREFRLIFENIGTNWNQQLPAIHVVNVKTR